MSYKTIIFEKQGSVAVIKFNRPEALNAINPELVSDVHLALDEIEKDPSLRVVVLTGEGDKAFIAGADISYMVNLPPVGARGWSEEGHNFLFRVENFPLPVIACVNGFALGGGLEIALTCDFIYASENAKFGQPEINLGIIPGFGGTQRLSRLVGRGVAKEFCMAGGMISAQEAKAIGLVNKVFPSDKLWEETLKIAHLIASKGKVSLRSVKQCIDRGYEMDLRQGCQMEAEHFELCMSSPDAKEGMNAFLEKRKPNFKGQLH